jgi:hypothetical protein
MAVRCPPFGSTRLCRVALDDYSDLLAFADLRGGNEYVTHPPGRAEEVQVCAIVLARYGPTGGGAAEATLLIELDGAGAVIDDSLYLAPRAAMDSWPMVSWEPLAGVADAAALIRQRMTS